jgi:hypothetical protein
MGLPTSEVGYTSATTRRGDHEVHKEHEVALGKKYVTLEYKKLTESIEFIDFKSISLCLEWFSKRKNLFRLSI